MCYSQVGKCRIALAKEPINRKRRLLCGLLDIKLRRKTVKCFVWTMLLYVAETWTLRKEEEIRYTGLRDMDVKKDIKGVLEGRSNE